MKLTYRKTLLVGGTAVVIAGLGGTALAATGSDAPAAGTGTATSAHGAHHGKKHRSLLQRAEHAQLTTGGKKHSVTHTLYRGTVSAVSSSSLTVTAADGTSQAYKLDSKTKYAERAKGKKPVASTLSKIDKGDRVFVSGVGKPTVTAKRVLELPAKK